MDKEVLITYRDDYGDHTYTMTVIVSDLGYLSDEEVADTAKKQVQHIFEMYDTTYYDLTATVKVPE